MGSNETSDCFSIFFTVGRLPPKKGLATTSSSSSDPRYFLALFDARLSSPFIAVKDRFIEVCGVKKFFRDGVMFDFSMSRFFVKAVISCIDLDRFGEKYVRIDFGDGGGFGI
jgi:hypothetical protein